MDSDEAITVLVVDGHQTFAELLGHALAGQPDLRWVGHARTGAEAISLAAELRPDVIVLDPELSDADGIAIAELIRVRQPDSRVVILTASEEQSLVRRATTAGAAGFLSKNGALGDVLNALRTAHRGSMTVSTDILARLLRSTTPATAPRGGVANGGLTVRENEVLQLMAAGLDARTVARRLGISVHTCRGYQKAVLAKLGAHSQLEAVAIATRRGLVRPDPR
ncbi:DNA-binding NarL/FixJ family response regulator [Actinoplanes campanulatus]|uniref:DNA-binding NarL/FixJ family response regulator n=1 Tax=Actinoplanes campanulatus TaxID=113559 RepID=A0A7W5AMC5_9ACTN|nr:response regulator transcription factor [Actinoplanes campanulatus]MBB3098692.1 DNA-binding NarL/FixJ family response regulator [Actinoplanes campanulatus]GGN37528.1 DNA-binding response regulator [Actinoplanes campanulatus]GID40807.1 DNA-binding response regulator [Actinoplanes campanulatus]